MTDRPTDRPTLKLHFSDLRSDRTGTKQVYYQIKRTNKLTRTDARTYKRDGRKVALRPKLLLDEYHYTTDYAHKLKEVKGENKKQGEGERDRERGVSLFDLHTPPPRRTRQFASSSNGVLTLHSPSEALLDYCAKINRPVWADRHDFILGLNNAA